MQFQMRRLVEVLKDIDGFKDLYDNIIPNFTLKRRYCYGRIKGKRVLQTGYCWFNYEYWENGYTYFLKQIYQKHNKKRKSRAINPAYFYSVIGLRFIIEFIVRETHSPSFISIS